MPVGACITHLKKTSHLIAYWSGKINSEKGMHQTNSFLTTNEPWQVNYRNPIQWFLWFFMILFNPVECHVYVDWIALAPSNWGSLKKGKTHSQWGVFLFSKTQKTISFCQKQWWCADLQPTQRSVCFVLFAILHFIAEAVLLLVWQKQLLSQQDLYKEILYSHNHSLIMKIFDFFAS